METFTDGNFAASQKFRALNGVYAWTQQVMGAYHPQALAGHSFVVHGCY